MNIQNRKRISLKEEVVNEITLNDLLDLGSKAQISVMQLSDNCMKFSDAQLRKLSARVNRDLGLLCDQIRGAIISNQDEQQGPQRSQLEKPKDSSNMIESENLGLEVKPEMDELSEQKEVMKEARRLFKKLKEAFGEEELEADTEEKTAAPVAETTPAPVDSKIDLSLAFGSVLEGLDEEEFVEFKTKVTTALKASGITEPDFQTLVTQIENTVGIDDLNFALDKVYDYADQNSIEVSTVVAGEEVEEEAEEEKAEPVISESKKRK